MTPLAKVTLRARLRTEIRAFFGAQRFLEVDTPTAVVCPGTEVHLRYFRTAWQDHRGAAHELYLRSSPELHMKQVMAFGAPRIFQLAPCFRNGGELADWHHPEFTMLEWYESGVSGAAFIDQTEALLRETAAALAADVRAAGGTPLTLPRTLPRITVAEAFARWAGVELVDGDPDLAARGLAAGCLSLDPRDDFETAFFKLQLTCVEPGLAALGGAVLLDYPPSQAALAKIEGGVAKRFEFYVGQVELANGFEELVDEAANRSRVAEATARRGALGYEQPADDQDFYAALARGLPPCCGNALGFDRWLALLAGLPGIGDVLPFRRAAPYKAALARDS